MEDIEKYTRKWKGIPHQRIGRINIVKITFLPKATCRFKKKKIPINIPTSFFTEIEKNNCKIHMETQNTSDSEISLEQKEQCWKAYNSKS